jgi:hypothetical protein
VYYLRTILMLLMAIRLLMPPGICVCKLNSPAARTLAQLLGLKRDVPPAENDPNPDDHDPGCPASSLSAALGLRPPSEPMPPLLPALEHLPTSLQSTCPCLLVSGMGDPSSAHPDKPSHLTLCILVI